jgi:hypothetical protein
MTLEIHILVWHRHANVVWYELWKINSILQIDIGKIEVVSFVIKYGRKLTIGVIFECQEMTKKKLFLERVKSGLNNMKKPIKKQSILTLWMLYEK